MRGRYIRETKGRRGIKFERKEEGGTKGGKKEERMIVKMGKNIEKEMK